MRGAMSLILNEQTKLLAGAFNTAATSSFTVGVLAPLAAAFYDVGGRPVRFGWLVVGTTIWFLAAAALHYRARRVLRNLRE